MLRESDRCWAIALAGIGNAVIVSDAAGRVSFMNSVAEELTGWTLEEAARRPVRDMLDLVDEKGRPEAGDPMARAMSDTSAAGGPVRSALIRRGGTGAPIDRGGVPIRDDEGNITVALVFRDVTERVRTEESLLGVKCEWERTFDHIPDLIAIMDRNHNIMRANRAMVEHLGVRNPEECIGQKCYRCVHGTCCPHALTMADGRKHMAEVHEEAWEAISW